MAAAIVFVWFFQLACESDVRLERMAGNYIAFG